MAIDNPNVVDAIGIDHRTGEAVLTISDHLEWDDSNQHLLILQEKINHYIGFIEAGELLESYPMAADRPIRVDIVCKNPPNQVGERFLFLANETFEKAGWTLSWRWWSGK